MFSKFTLMPKSKKRARRVKRGWGKSSEFPNVEENKTTEILIGGRVEERPNSDLFMIDKAPMKGNFSRDLYNSFSLSSKAEEPT